MRLWVRRDELLRTIKDTRENRVYLPGVRLSSLIHATTSLEEALSRAGFIVCAIPSHGIREIFQKASRFISVESVVVSASKGIEEDSLLTCSGILMEILPSQQHHRITVLSGPSFAREVSRGLPTAVCVGCREMDVGGLVQRVFSTAHFRVYTNRDITGVEIGGALKNVIAIASGVSDGLGLGYNARAALITRGLAEISRLGVRMGADPLTFSGLSGLGDLLLTCTGELSRNRKVGLEVGRGRKLGEVIKDMVMVAEGVRTSRAVLKLARKYRVDMPITEEVNRILYEDKDPKRAVMELMTRRLKEETG